MDHGGWEFHVKGGAGDQEIKGRWLMTLVALADGDDGGREHGESFQSIKISLVLELRWVRVAREERRATNSDAGRELPWKDWNVEREIVS